MIIGDVRVKKSRTQLGQSIIIIYFFYVIRVQRKFCAIV
jgi:hypothetical protein